MHKNAEQYPNIFSSNNKIKINDGVSNGQFAGQRVSTCL